MKGFVTAFLALSLLISVPSAYAVSAIGTAPKGGAIGGGPALASTGGPDDYGYTWIDSDEPGGPAYQWVDITGVGTQVSGLGDDNSVGPFPIGFDFPYYWYTVNQFYIGSNGWISFSSGQNFAHPFAQLPNAALPNDLLACLAGDIDFTKGGECWYHTTSGADSLIVSYIDVPEFFGGTTRHTFQIILSRPDSTITYQYGSQDGNFGAGGSNAFSMGMENSTGTIGLNYFYNNPNSIPTNPPPFDSSTVIVFTPPDSTAFAVDDIGVVNGLTEAGKGIFLSPDSAASVWSDLKNFGNQTENAYGLSAIIQDGGHQTVYTDSIQGSAPIAPSEVVNFAFPDPFTPGAEGTFTATFGGHMAPGRDLVPSNDELEVEIQATSYPTDLLYDDGSNETAVSWNGDNSGFGNEFEPPFYPTKVTSAVIGVDASTAPGDMIVRILDDDGPGGGPGTILAADTVFVATTGLQRVDFTQDDIVIADGKFYVGAVAVLNSTLAFMMDQTPPLSRRGWEFTGGWAPNRSLSTDDVMIRAGVTFVFDAIADARIDADHDFIPDNLGQEAFVSGVLTGAAEHYGPDPAITYFQDATGAIGLLTPLDDTYPDRAEIIVRGTVGQIDGVTLLENPTMFQLVRFSAPLPTPVDIAAADLADGAGEAFEALFARFPSVTVIDDYPAEGSDGTVRVVDEAGDTATVFIDKDTNIDGSATPTTPVSMQGVVGQFADQGGTLDYGYALMPRELLDIEPAAGIGDGGAPGAGLPKAFSLSQNYPNPFNPSTTIGFDVPADGAVRRVTLAVYDIRGRQVRTLIDGEMEPGRHTVGWNGRDDRGHTVSSGIYLYTLRTGDETFTRKMTILK